MVVELRALDLGAGALEVVHVEFYVELWLELDGLDGHELPTQLEHRSAVERLRESRLTVDGAVLVLVVVDDARHLLRGVNRLRLSPRGFVVKDLLRLYHSARVLETLVAAAYP